MCQGKHGAWTLAGVISWGMGCARGWRRNEKKKHHNRGSPGIFTDLSVVLSWVQENMSAGNYVSAVTCPLLVTNFLSQNILFNFIFFLGYSTYMFSCQSTAAFHNPLKCMMLTGSCQNQTESIVIVCFSSTLPPTWTFFFNNDPFMQLAS